jgi:hypothetical protein
VSIVITLSLPGRNTHQGHVEAKGDRVNFRRRSPQKRGHNSTPLHNEGEMHAASTLLARMLDTLKDEPGMSPITA